MVNLFQSFHIFVRAQRKIRHHLDGLSNTKDPSYLVCLGSDCCIIIWLLNSMEKKVNSGVIFFKTVKKI